MLYDTVVGSMSASRIPFAGNAGGGSGTLDSLTHSLTHSLAHSLTFFIK